jgi:hypothetical protein
VSENPQPEFESSLAAAGELPFPVEWEAPDLVEGETPDTPATVAAESPAASVPVPALEPRVEPVAEEPLEPLEQPASVQALQGEPVTPQEIAPTPQPAIPDTTVEATTPAEPAVAAAPASATTESIGEGTPEVGAGPTESAPSPNARVERATFTTEVVELEPLDSIDTLSNDRSEVYYFTELRGMEGQTVTHRWEFNGRVLAEVPITVAGPRWRAYTVKGLEPNWLGEWTASVVDSRGNVLRTDKFSYTESEPAAVPAAEPPRG